MARKNPDFLRQAKAEGRKISSLTAYDYPTARLLDECGLDFLLVGDSLGMVVLGYPDTTSVTMDHMAHHTAAVARAAQQTWVVADMPFESYAQSANAVANAKRLAEAGADAVKLEGGMECLPIIRDVQAAGVPVVGHLGMLPQRVREEGGYRIKGKSDSEADALVASAKALDAAGVSAIVLELVHRPLAEEISRVVGVPTIGIGSGTGCDGQILVLHDVVGLFPWFRPKFAEQRADVAAEIQRAAREFVAGVRGA